MGSGSGREGEERKGKGGYHHKGRKDIVYYYTFTQNDNNPPFEYSVYKGNVKINVKLYQEQ